MPRKNATDTAPAEEKKRAFTPNRNLRMADDVYDLWLQVAEADGFPDRSSWLRFHVLARSRELGLGPKSGR